MTILLVGHGGREAALAWRLARSPSTTRLLVVGPNPGWPARAELRPTQGVEAIVALARAERVDLVVVGPEGPLDEGLVDALQVAAIPAFGPVRAAARLESSKAFAKEVMAAAGVPTAQALVVHVDRADEVAAGRNRCREGRVVVKADGLAAGKGVFVCPDPEDAVAAFEEVVAGGLGSAGAVVLLEELLDGPEVSVFGLCDGSRVVGLPSCQDHKRVGEGDVGPNTGGMGAIAPCPAVPDAEAVERVLDLVHRPVVAEMARRGVPFRGVLYAGLMMTADGPKVLEFNTRFGDPECQVLMRLWGDDPVPHLLGAARGELRADPPRFAVEAAVVVVLASAGYPGSSTKGVAVPEPTEQGGVVTFHAGTARDADGELVTAGGRVLGVSAVGEDLATARAAAMAAVPGWAFPGMVWRRDIGARWS